MLKSFNAKYLAGFAINDTELKDNELLLAYPNTGHESLRHLSLAKHLNLIVEDEAMEYPVINDDEKALHKLNLPLQAQQYVCIHAGSRGAWRQWPITYFAALADICIKNGLKIVLTGTPNELEIANKLAKHIDGNCINLAGKTHLGSIGALLKNAALLIANCTGVSHIAAGLKTPSLIISMDGEPERWAPLNNHLHFSWHWI
jgi:ADP-heptose:LPS heptosyltransferase